MWILAGIFGIILLINLVLGPTVRTYLKSAVQTEELGSLNRLRRAHKAIARLEPLIITAQGRLGPEEIAAQIQNFSNVSVSVTEAASPNPPPSVNP
jgi:hypothetical protein